MIAGEVIYFYECEPTFVERRYQAQCTQELAVEWKNESWYMAPFTKKLVKESSAVPCTDVAYPQFLIGENEWVNFRGAPTMDLPRYLDPQDPVWNLGFVDLQERRAK